MLRLIAQICCGFLNLVSLIDQRPRSGFLMVHLFFMPQMICFLFDPVICLLRFWAGLGSRFYIRTPYFIFTPLPAT
jgi:hypothetical protein